MEEEDKEEGKFLEGQMNAIFNPLEKLANSKAGKAVGKAVGAVNEASLNIGAQFIGGQLGAPIAKFAVNQGVIGYDKALGSLHQFISDKTNIDQRAVGLVADPLNFVPGIGLAGKARVANTTTRTATKAASFQRKLQKGIQNSLKAERGAIRVGSKNNKLNKFIDGLSTKVHKAHANGHTNGNGNGNGHVSISEDFAPFINQKVRNTKNPKLPKDIAGPFRAYGQDVYEKFGNLSNYMQLVHEGITWGLKDNSRKLKSGKQSLKVTSMDQRSQMNRDRGVRANEQTLGKHEYKKGHHRLELNLVDRVMEGLSEVQRSRFVKTVNKQFDNLVTGNKAANLIGNLGELPDEIHKQIHRKLEDAGLNARKMDFRKADFKTRLRFMREVQDVLGDIDEFIYESMRGVSKPLEGA